MTQASTTAQEIEDLLRAGSTPQEVVKMGYPNGSVYRMRDRLAKEAGETKSKGKSREKKEPEAPDHSGVRVRLTQEEITLPASMFILYDMVVARHPRYQATKSEWLMDVVQTWAIDHAQELGFEFMFPGLFPPESDEDGGPEDDESLEALESEYPIEDFDPGERTGRVLPGPGGRSEDESSEESSGAG